MCTFYLMILKYLEYFFFYIQPYYKNLLKWEYVWEHVQKGKIFQSKLSQMI